jgi:putative NADH-flavin reductase
VTALRAFEQSLFETNRATHPDDVRAGITVLQVDAIDPNPLAPRLVGYDAVTSATADRYVGFRAHSAARVQKALLSLPDFCSHRQATVKPSPSDRP